MDYEIDWSDVALEDYQRILDYLLLNWSKKVSDNFEIKLNQKLNSLRFQPHRGVLSPKYADVRNILITEQNKLYYHIGENSLSILTIIDTRQDPDKNPFL